jgi:hypothetical protein
MGGQRAAILRSLRFDSLAARGKQQDETTHGTSGSEVRTILRPRRLSGKAASRSDRTRWWFRDRRGCRRRLANVVCGEIGAAYAARRADRVPAPRADGARRLRRERRDEHPETARDDRTNRYWGLANINRWSDPTYDQMYDQYKRELDPEKRKATAIQLDNYILAAGIRVPMIIRNDVYATRPDLINVEYSPFSSESWNIGHWTLKK